MRGADWTPAEVALLREWTEQGVLAPEVAERFQQSGINRTIKAITRRREKLGIHALVQPSPFPVYDAPLVIEGDTLNLFDLHCPFHDAPLVNRLVALARKWGIRKATVGGDAVDFAGFSKYGRKLGTEAEDEIRATEQTLNTLAAEFEEVGYCPGGHEKRLARMVGWLLRMDYLMNLWVSRKNIKTTRRHYLFVVSGGQRFLIGHPDSYSRNATYTAKQIASNQRCHAILGHDHIIGMTRDVSDTWWAIDAGICADPKRLDYLQERLTTHPKAMQGAVIIKDGVPIPLTPQNLPLYERFTVG